MKTIFEVPAGSDFEKQLKMLNLTESDLAIAQTLKPLVEENISNIVVNFYENLENNPQLIQIITDNSSLERLKGTLNSHFIQMFSGEMNADFIEKRKVIANIHVKIGLTQKWYIASFESIFNGLVDTLIEHYRNEDLILALKTVNKLLNFEQQLVIEAYDDEVTRLRDLETNARIEMIRSIEHMSTKLAMLAENTSASIQEMNEQIGVVVTNSKSGTLIAKEATKVADQGKSRLSAMSRSLEIMESSTSKVSDDMISLENTSIEIRNIIEIVNSVADQTNLLALNASIEAARAGEQGLGFAVVADEVRKLAEETGKSVTNVTALINQTGEQIAISNTSMQEVERYLSEVREHMEITEHAFSEIDDNMESSATSNQRIQDDLEGFDQVIHNIAEASTIISQSADNLREMIESRA